MFTLLSHICLSLAGNPLPEGIFDDYFFYQLRSKKKISDTLLDRVKQVGKHTPYQLAILGIPPEEKLSSIEAIFHGPKFSDYFFKGGRPSYISVGSEPIDYGIHDGNHCIYHFVSVTLYFDDEESMIEAGIRIHHQGTHPKKGYKLKPMKVGVLSKCSHCGKFLPLVSEKYRHTIRWVQRGRGEVWCPKNCSDQRCTTCEMKSSP